MLCDRAQPPHTYGIVDEAKNYGLPEPWFSRWSKIKVFFFTAELERKSGITGIPFVRTELFTAWGLLKSENAESKKIKLRWGLPFRFHFCLHLFLLLWLASFIRTAQVTASAPKFPKIIASNLALVTVCPPRVPRVSHGHARE